MRFMFVRHFYLFEGYGWIRRAIGPLMMASSAIDNLGYTLDRSSTRLWKRVAQFEGSLDLATLDDDDSHALILKTLHD